MYTYRCRLISIPLVHLEYSFYKNPCVETLFFYLIVLVSALNSNDFTKSTQLWDT